MEKEGIVKWFNNAKGWGFIQLDDDIDVFVHYSQIAGDGFRTLKQGETVNFELREGPRGHFAESVRFTDEEGINVELAELAKNEISAEIPAFGP